MDNSTDDKLSEYCQKRNFTHTKEPIPETKIEYKRPLYVIQKHAATNLHYDLRLEIDGILKSWVIPKGPSLDSQIKRMAVLTEDHPLAYATFEGLIPKDEYGGGTVIVWDIGTYRNIQSEKEPPVSMDSAFKQGKIEVYLEGKKLKGKFALIRINQNWLFFKMKDNYIQTNDILNNEPKSAISGLDIDQIGTS